MAVMRVGLTPGPASYCSQFANVVLWCPDSTMTYYRTSGFVKHSEVFLEKIPRVMVNFYFY